MKIAIFALLSSMTVFAAQVPADSVFNAVGKQSEQLGYFGYDVTVCLSKNGSLAAGGLSFWNTPLHIYIVNANGSITATTRVSSADEQTNHKFEDAKGNDIELILNQGKNQGQVVVYEDAALTVGPAEMAQLVSCYTRLSGLE